MEYKPKRLAEANIQAEIYHQCRLLNIPCYLEYKHSTSVRKSCRFDAVIHDGVNILAIIEVKSRMKNPARSRERWFKSKQYQRYAAFNVPIFYINTLPDVPDLIEQIKGGL